MAVHGVQPGKGKNDETGDWNVKSVTGKIVKDTKGKPLSGFSFATAAVHARAYLNRTGEYVVPVRG